MKEKGEIFLKLYSFLFASEIAFLKKAEPSDCVYEVDS